MLYQPIIALQHRRNRGRRGARSVATSDARRWSGRTSSSPSPRRAAPSSRSVGRFSRKPAARSLRLDSAVPDHAPLMLAVNLSASQLKQPTFAEDLEQMLQRDAAFRRHRLALEMTETAMFSDTHSTLARLEALRHLGVQMAVDDFGTGYSSLGYLRRFRVDILKLARDFVGRSEVDGEDWVFANAIVALGPDAWAEHHCRGHRGARPAQAAARAGLRVRPGLPLRRSRPTAARSSACSRRPSLRPMRPARRSQRAGLGRPCAHCPRATCSSSTPSSRASAVGLVLRGDLGRLSSRRLSLESRSSWPACSSRSCSSTRPSPHESANSACRFTWGPPWPCLVAVLRNVRLPGFAVIFAGGLSNFVAIVANGGYMPASPEAVASFGVETPEIYSNSAVLDRAGAAAADRHICDAALDAVRQRFQHRRRADRHRRHLGDRGDHAQAARRVNRAGGHRTMVPGDN